jgi:hypothetical protein
MRPTVLLVLLSLAACGPSKPPADATEATNAPPPDETPKWEGATPQPTATATSTGAAPVQEATARRNDQYDKDATEVVLKRAGRQVKDNCGAAKDDDGKASGPWGKVTIQVVLGRNGHSKGVTVPAPFDGKASGKCIVQAFSNLTFPPWAGTDTPVDWEVEVAQPGGAGPAPKK